MKQKLLDLLEKYVDKLILVIIAIASLALLWFFVISNPYGAEHNRVMCSPGSIDAKIKVDAENLKLRIIGNATEPIRVYPGNMAGQYGKKMASSVKINEKAIIPTVGLKSSNIEDKRFYRKPSIPAVAGVAAEVIRTAVFVPTEKVEMAMPYEQAQTEVSDIDFVTVEASIDVSELYKNFRNSFVNGASADYKDENLAVPVFAAVGLEKQVFGEDGQWSDWEVVNRPQIDKRRGIVVPEKAKDIDLGGIDVLVMNFKEFDVQRDVLQPMAYDVAASNAEWMTPGYHKELVKFIEKEAKDAEMEASGRVRPTSRGGRNDSFGGVGTGTRFDGRSGRTKRGGRPGRPNRTPAATTRKDRTIEDIRADFDFLKITEDVDMSLMKEPLVFWAFDDDIKPLRNYRYRIRLGVFNPTASKGWFSGSDAAFKDDVILWSEYSEVTEEITIDPMVYFFPLEVARRTKAATIQVSKFHDGKWQSEEFDVQVGESIGQEVEVEDEEGTAKPKKRSKVVEEVKMIDFSSGAILVDIVESRRSVAGGRPFQEILYTENGSDIKHLGVTKRNWSKVLSSTFKDIEAHQDIIVEIFESRGQSGRGMYPSGRMGEGMEDYEEMMMYEEF